MAALNRLSSCYKAGWDAKTLTKITANHDNITISVQLSWEPR